MSLLELLCAVDDFCLGMKKEQVGRLLGRWQPVMAMNETDKCSKALTITIQFHRSQSRTFKAYYQESGVFQGRIPAG